MEGAGNAGALWNPEGREYAKSILQRRAADIIAQQQMLPEQLELGEPDVTTGAIRSPFTGQLITADLTQLSPTTPGYQNIVDGIQALKLNVAEIMDIVGDSLPAAELAGAQETVGRPAAGDDEEKARRAAVEREFAGRDAWADSRKLAALTSSLNVRISTLAPYLSADAMEELYAAVADVLTTLRPLNGKGASITNAIRRLEDARKYLERSAQWATLPLKDRIERNKQLQKEFDIVSGLPGRREKIPTQEQVATAPQPAAPGTPAAAAAAARTVEAQTTTQNLSEKKFYELAAGKYNKANASQIEKDQVLVAVLLYLNGYINIPQVGPRGGYKEKEALRILKLESPNTGGLVIEPLRSLDKKYDGKISEILRVYNTGDKPEIIKYINRLVKPLKDASVSIKKAFPNEFTINYRRDMFDTLLNFYNSPAVLGSSIMTKQPTYAEQLEVKKKTIADLKELATADKYKVARTKDTGDVSWSPSLLSNSEKLFAKQIPDNVREFITGEVAEPVGVEGVEETKEEA